jgi:nucleoside-diphosphate-sugar epimerase
MEDHRQAYRGRVALVTGGAGCIGSNLTRALVDAGIRRVVVLDDLSSSVRWNVPDLGGVDFVHGSMLDEETLRHVFRAKPDFVFHLAALFANQNSIDHPERDLQVNGLGTLRVLQYAHLAGVQRVVYASSGCSVYGSKAPLPLSEDFVSLDLDTPYQITKLLGELYCNFYGNYYGLPVVRARFFNVYGPGEVPGRYRNVIPNFVYRAMSGLPLPVMGTGEETRDFTFVADIVDGVMRAGTVPGAAGEAYNLASGRETRVRELVAHVEEAVGMQCKVESVPRRDWDRITRRCASIDKARAGLGYEPRTTMREGIAATVAWFRRHLDDIRRDARF